MILIRRGRKLVFIAVSGDFSNKSKLMVLKFATSYEKKLYRKLEKAIADMYNRLSYALRQEDRQRYQGAQPTPYYAKNDDSEDTA